VIDPWGNVLADAGDMPGVAVAQIDPKRLAQVRQQLPVLQHQRLESGSIPPVKE
jgi:predicted amidohydrolase